MAGIVGISSPVGWDCVNRMLLSISHRGRKGQVIAQHGSATLGEVHSEGVAMWLGRTGGCRVVCDGAIYNWQQLAPESLDVDQAIEMLYLERGPSFLSELQGAFAIAISLDQGVFLARDGLGIAPLYWGVSDQGIVFASEVKALVGRAEDISEFPPGSYFSPCSGLARFFNLSARSGSNPDPATAARQLRERLSQAVAKCVRLSKGTGCWLSGGLDSSVLAALLNEHHSELHTFSVGLDGASDLACARTVAEHIGSHHHEAKVTADDLMQVLDEVIYHLESFDAPLVRSSLTNYVVSKLAAEQVDSVVSGEGSDELFAGYDYLKTVQQSELNTELMDITANLHNTALQRVDRCANAHGLTAHTPFLDDDVRDYALSLPTEYKMRHGNNTVAKWVLRQAACDLLPDQIVHRPKAKFWEGAGVSDVVASGVNEMISDEEFENEKRLPDGQTLTSKEELLYFRVFSRHFGWFEDYSFVGRTKPRSGSKATGAAPDY